MKGLSLLYHSRRLLAKPKLGSSSVSPYAKLGCVRTLSMISECPQTREVIDYLDSLKDHEKLGVPQNAGTDTDDGFDLGRMRRLMDRLGNPQTKYKVIHVAGTKGKGSTAAFLSNMFRAEGYSVGCYTSPHIRTIRERMSVGSRGEPVSASDLHSLFLKMKKILDQAVAQENGRLSHFEVLTAIAFKLFADTNVDIVIVEAGLGGARDATNVVSSSELAVAVITTIGKEHLAALGGSLQSIALAKSGIIKDGRPVILGGPFLPHIEQIIRDKALSMGSPVISSSEAGCRSLIKDFCRVNGEPRQSCDIEIESQKHLPLSLELQDVKLSMLGHHQLQNALTATCAALCLRNQGWGLSDRALRTALETTQLLGRGQFLKKEEMEMLGLSGSMLLLDGAHTQESAKALANTISMASQGSKLVLVVAMASDKDHIGFARELLSGLQLEAVFLTEVDIAGDKHRTTSSLLLKDKWTDVCVELGNEFVSEDVVSTLKPLDSSGHAAISSNELILYAESSLTNCLTAAHRILKARAVDQSGIIIVTGSLHIVSSVLASVQD